MVKSPIKAHNAGQVVECPGSVLMQALVPPCDTGDESRNQAKLEGRAFHEVTERILNGYQPNGTLLSRNETIGTMSKDRIVITDEIYDAAEDFTNDVLKDCNGLMSKVVVERRVELGHLFPDMYGFPDVWCYDPVNKHLMIWEGKFGHSIVEAFENYQNLTYVSGIIEELGLSLTSVKVTMKIVQPRGFHRDGSIREWIEPVENLVQYFNVLHDAFMLAYSGDAKCRVNSTCRTCNARYGCEAYTTGSQAAYDYCGSVVDNSLNGNNLAIEVNIVNKMYDIIKNRKSALEAQAMSEIRSGKQVPGYALLQGYGHTRWKKDIPVDQVIMMGDVMGEDLRKPPQLITPKQVIKKGLDEDVINLYSETPKTSLKLVNDTNGAKARQTFK